MTVRSNGAAAAAAPVIAALGRHHEVKVVCGPRERERIIAERPEAGAAEFVHDIDDPAALTGAIERFRPDMCLRGSPADGLDGPDEWIGGCLRRSARAVPLVALQDDYGAGRALEDATVIATVDEHAVRLLAEEVTGRAVVVGWTALDHLSEGDDPLTARRKARAGLDLPSDGRLVVYLTGPGDRPSDQRNIRQLAGVCADARDLLLMIKAHPRLDGSAAAALRALAREDPSVLYGDAVLPQVQWFAVGDCLIGDGSSMLRDAAAYHRLWPAEAGRSATVVVDLAGRPADDPRVVAAALGRSGASSVDVDGPRPDGRATWRVEQLIGRVLCQAAG